MQSGFKDVIHQMIQPLKSQIETLTRNNNALIASNNELVQTISIMKQAGTESASRVERLEKVSKILDHRVQSVEKTETVITKQLQHDRGKVEKLLLTLNPRIPTTATTIDRTTAEDKRIAKRAMQVKGSGDNIGAKQLLHVAVTRVPLNDSIDSTFLQNSIDVRFATIGAKIVDISLL